ncbi:MAG: hypothetical protein FP826_07975 [Sphingomonadales bacterium]|nr:hypothetical protein [Sphingomonadales bacterium]MBU3992186.1 hypothetical protein [Alphaproteobacteria bacterium]
MANPTLLLALTTLIGLGIVAMTVLAIWQGWLQLKLHELDRTRDTPETTPLTSHARIELADVKERLRRLEAIAAGVDL